MTYAILPILIAAVFYLMITIIGFSASAPLVFAFILAGAAYFGVMTQVFRRRNP
ncbi:MAG: hypothetical protein SF029_22455 [bacterium]|nr:hypothetical protein [bacterium]